jgi:hypothetical protein
MESRRNGEFKRSVLSALAAMVAAAVPSLISSPALAEKPEKTPEGAPAAEAKAAAAPKQTAAKSKKAHKAQKPQAKQDAQPKKAEEAHAKSESKPAASAKGKKIKKTAARTAGKGKKMAKKADKEAPGRRCQGTAIAIDRSGLEAQNLALLDCHKKPIEASQTALSVLARPWGASKPAHLAAVHPASKASKGQPPTTGELAPGVRLLDRGLLVRVDAIARRFPGRPISLVSGYRPQSRGSLHQSARALDLRVAGVTNEELVAFCKTLADTGCGYYPNSSFVHVDVRNPGTGVVSWIDSSGPGEAPHYVKQWPPRPEDSDTAVLPPEDQRHDRSIDPWELDPADEHAALPDAAEAPVPPIAGQASSIR